MCDAPLAPAGGQVGDHGVLVVAPAAGQQGQPEAVLLVSNVKKAAGGRLWVHTCELQSGQLRVGQQVRAWLAVCHPVTFRNDDLSRNAPSWCCGAGSMRAGAVRGVALLWRR